jgi:transposase
MAAGKKVYPREFKRRMVELVRAGRSPESLAKEFDPSANTIRKWATQADLDEGLRADGLTTAERKELRELRRKVKQMELEREILGKAAAWFARESITLPKPTDS